MFKHPLARNLLPIFLAAVLVSAGACANPEQKFERHMERAQARYEEQDFPAARIELINAIKLKPSSGQAYYLLGQVLAGMQDYRGAVRALAAANELMPDDRGAALQLSHLLFAGNAYPMVESVAGDWTRNFPQDEDFLALLSLAQARQGKKRESLETAGRLVEAYPRSVNSWLNLVQVSLLTGDTPGAERALERAEGLEPDSVKATLIRIDLLLKRGQPEDGLRLMKELVSRHPERMDLKVRLGGLYENLGRKNDAMATYREVAEQESLPPVLYRLGLLLYDAGQKEEALTAWERSLEADPNFVDSKLAMAGHYISGKEFPRALEIVEDALESAPRDERLFVMRGKISLAEGKWDEAGKDFTRALESRPDLPEAKFLLAQAQLRNGEITDGIGNLKDFLEKQPEHPLANLLLARIEGRLGQLEASSMHAAAASRDEAHGREALWVLTDNALRQGKFAEGKVLGERNQRRFGAHPGTTMRLARSKELLGDTAGAEKDYRSILETDKDSIAPITGLVALLIKTGRQDEALDLAGEKAAAGGIPQRLLLGRTLESAGDLPGARDVYMSIIEERPDFLEPYQRIVAVYARESNLEEAEKWLAGFMEKSGEPDIRLLFLEALIQENLEKKTAASATYQRILKIEPEFVPALNNLAWNLSEAGQMVEALKISTKARNLAPENPHLADTHAWILHKSGDSHGALPLLRQAMEGLPGNEAVGSHLVEVLEAVGRTGEARQLRDSFKEGRTPAANP